MKTINGLVKVANLSELYLKIQKKRGKKMTMFFTQAAKEYTAKNINTNKNTDKSVPQKSVSTINDSIFNNNSKYELLSFGKTRMGIFADKVSDNTPMDEYVGNKGTSPKKVTEKDNDTISKYEELRNYIEDVDNTAVDEDETEVDIEQPKRRIIGVSRDLGTPLNKLFTETASSRYEESLHSIRNTNYGDRLIRRKKMNQVVKETFFYGANRFGNNFIA